MPNKIYNVIGLMSGTSLDGVDAALLETDGEGHIVPKAFLSLPYAPALREQIRACFGQHPDKLDDKARAAEKALTQAHSRAVQSLLAERGLAPKDIDFIGFHGQTLSHDPAAGYTCQIGDAQALAKETGISVVNDFRTADVKAGGQGAPLVPVYHQALATVSGKPVAFLNIGGVANVSYVGAKGELIAFDTGPGNALIDDWMLQKTGKALDKGGALAKTGKIDENLLQQLLAHPFFAAKPPKSLDRNAFVSDGWKNLSPADGAATLAAFTVQSIARAAQFFPEKPKQWIVAGGGRHNAFIMQKLEAALGAPVASIDDLGFNGDATEAEAFGYLAVRSVQGLPLSFPLTTGVPQPQTGGTLHKCP